MSENEKENDTMMVRNIPAELRKRFKLAAVEADRSMGSLFVEFMENYVSECSGPSAEESQPTADQLGLELE